MTGTLTDLEKWKILAKSDANQAVSDFSEQPPEKAEMMAMELGIPYLVHFVSQVGTDAAADFLRALPDEFRRKVFEGLPPDRGGPLQELLSYAPGTAGSIMAKEVLSVPITHTIGQVTEYLQSIPRERRGKVSYIYVVDHNRRLEGVIQVRDLVFYPSKKPVAEILRSPVVQVETGMSQLDVARLLQRHRYLGLPVVNAAQQLVGVVNADSAMQVLDEKASDDIAKMIGTGAEEMRSGSVRTIVRLRLPWLFISILSGLLCAYISGIFQNSLQTLTVLFLFVPMVLGLSESAGIQSATIVVRNITRDNLSAVSLSPLLFKEALAGVFIGLACGSTVGLVAHLWKGVSRLGWAIAASMAVSIIVSALIGLTLPVLFKRLKIDPAMASGPLVLAICDMQTLLIYFTLSGYILGR